jgi:hypothetical protein
VDDAILHRQIHRLVMIETVKEIDLKNEEILTIGWYGTGSERSERLVKGTTDVTEEIRREKSCGSQ